MRCAALVICYKYEEFLHGEEAILPLGGNSAHCGGIPGLLSFLKVIFFFFFSGILPRWLRWVGLSCRTGVSVWLQIRGASCPEVLGMQQQYRHRQGDEKWTATEEEKFPPYFFCCASHFRKDTPTVMKGRKENMRFFLVRLSNTGFRTKKIVA